MTGLALGAGDGRAGLVRAGIAAIAVLLTLSGCARQPVYSTDQRIFLAQSYCVSAKPDDAFESRDAACGYYQSHFVKSSVGTPQDLLAYITATKTHCEIDARQCPKYWNSVSEDKVLTQSYPGIDVHDPEIWAAKRAAVKACTDDGHPIGPDGGDAKPAACLQAARLLRGDQLAPQLLRQIEHQACDLGEVDECHYATMDGETVDIKASQAIAAERARQAAEHGAAMNPYDPTAGRMSDRTITPP